ncbi:MAG: hypothetical protein IE927_01590, partial [Rhodobacterales bacterium]|nr:hypothetical protein [Rhodobacterales bacterium]
MIVTILFAALFVMLSVLVARRGRAVAHDAAERALEQLAHVVPQLCVALLAAGFLAKLIPAEWIGGLLGASFLRLRLLSVAFVPIAAGLIAAGIVRQLG